NLILHMLDREPRRRPSAEDIARVFEDTGGSTFLMAPKADESNRQLLVGRHHELVKLRTLLESVCQQGPGKLVLITGEPGIGKTALVNGLLSEQSTIQRAFA